MLQKVAGENTVSTVTKHQMNGLPLLVTWHWHYPLLTLATKWPSFYSCEWIPEVTAIAAVGWIPITSIQAGCTLTEPVHVPSPQGKGIYESEYLGLGLLKQKAEISQE